MAKSEIQKTESPLTAAAALVQQADGKIDVDKLEALLKVQMQWEANEAKKSYVVAMAAFKEKPPEILKDKNVKYHTQKGDVDYKHATLHNVTTCINKALSEHGLTAAWVTSQANGSVKVTCKITHIMGHSEETCLDAPPDTTGSKNAIQAIGSTVTYLQRYTLLALTGLATADQDDDGKVSGSPTEKKPTKKEEQNAIVDQAFFDFECEQKEALLEGFVYSREKFEAAIIKHKKRLPTPKDKDSIRKILDLVKPEEVMDEVRDYSGAPELEEEQKGENNE
jgi:hypothetical protein